MDIPKYNSYNNSIISKDSEIEVHKIADNISADRNYGTGYVQSFRHYPKDSRFSGNLRLYIFREVL